MIRCVINNAEKIRIFSVVHSFKWPVRFEQINDSGV